VINGSVGSADLGGGAGIGASQTRMTRTSTPSRGRPTQTPFPSAVAWRVPERTSSEPMEETGKASVAP
jgi:hypothetical protein